jgi:hypothetical protein
MRFKFKNLFEKYLSQRWFNNEFCSIGEAETTVQPKQVPLEARQRSLRRRMQQLRLRIRR